MAQRGLDVTNGGPIYLYKEFTGGEQVVVGREGGPDGPIAFVIFVTPDGQALWVQEFLPIEHTDPADSPTNIPNDPDSIAEVLNDALLVRGTLQGTALTQTAPIGHHVAFVDDAPIAVSDAREGRRGNLALVLLPPGKMVQAPEPQRRDAPAMPQLQNGP